MPADDLKFDPEGKTTWYLYLDIYCLDYDGNVFDACLIALMAALQNGELLLFSFFFFSLLFSFLFLLLLGFFFLPLGFF